LTSKGLDRELAEQFDRALAFAAEVRKQLVSHSSDRFAYAAMLETALAPFDEACARLHTEIEVVADRAKPSAAEAAWLRASHVLAPLLEERDLGPRLLRNRDVLVDRDGTLLLDRDEMPTDGPTPRKQPPGCCFTWIQFRNITDKRLRLTLTHENGSRKRRIFAPGETRTANYREGADDTIDDDGTPVPGQGPVIPGGMGHCVTITAEVSDGNEWRQIVSQRLCCDDQPPPGPGTMIEDIRSVGGSPEHFARTRAFQIVDLRIERPCPNLAPSAPTPGQHGTADSQSSRSNGVETEPGKHLYGAGCWLRFIPRDCRSFCFVQGVKRRVFIQRPGQPERQAPLLGTAGNDFKLDIRKRDRTPCYPYVSDIEGGGKVLRDNPGVSNPWGSVLIEGKDGGSYPEGTVLKIEWTFRTWVVCLDGPPRMLGHFDWSMKVVITIGRGAADTRAEITPPSPTWSDDPDKAGYNKVAGQAPDHGGFITQ